MTASVGEVGQHNGLVPTDAAPAAAVPSATIAAGALRERKKARTRAAIQHQALRLFTEHGYDVTTVEQVAAAADVSPSTVFRYFPTKDDLVLTDELDPLLIAAFRDQPPELGTVAAFRATLRQVFGEVDAGTLADIKARATLILSVPELRAAMLDQLAQSITWLAELAAERTGRPADDPAARSLAGAVVGVWIAAATQWAAHPEDDLLAALDTALDHLEKGLALGSR